MSSRRTDPNKDLGQDPLSEINLQVLLVDRCGRISYANPAAETALAAGKGALSGRMLDSLISPRNPEWLCRQIRKNALECGWTGDAVLTGLNGQDWWFHVQACRVPVGRGFGDEIVLILEDINGQVELVDALMRRSEDLFRRNRELEIVNRLGKTLLDSTDLESRLSATIREAARAIGVDCGVLALLDPVAQRLYCGAVYGRVDDESTRSLSLELSGRTIVARTARNRRPYIAEDLNSEHTDLRESVIRYHAKSALYVPVVAGGKTLGVMVLCETQRQRSFSPEDVTLVQIIANHAASAIRSSALTEETRRAARFASAGELLAGATHDIGNALMSAHTALEVTRLIADSEQASSAVTARLDQAIKNVSSGSEIVHRVLEFITGGQVQSTRVSLSYAAQSAMSLCEAHPTARERSITNTIPAGLPAVAARPGPLIEVIFNLVLNALQATEPGGHVRLEADVNEESGQAELRVADDGCGMRPEVAERAFDPFFSTKGGTGLGLSSSQSIVREMGGVITVDTQPRRGATFTVRLSLAQQKPQARRAA